MRFGTNSFASIPFANSDLDASSIPAAVDLIANQELPRAYLFHATPYDPVGEDETDVRASIGLAYPILDSVAWPAYLKTAVDSQIDLFGDNEDSQGRSSFGNLELLIGDAEYDDIVDYYWDGRSIQVQLGADDFTIDEYVTVLSGIAEDVTYDKRRLSIVFRGKDVLLDKAIQETLYTGAGGLEGGDDIADSEKPLIFGLVRNLSPILVDLTNHVYQFHDGAAKSVLGAYDGGGALIDSGDVADITAVTVSPGYFHTQLSGGYLKLGASPEKALTIDVQGSNSGGYVETASDIIRRICINHTDLTESDLNMWAFFTARLDASRSICGVYITGQTAKEAITELMTSIGGAYAFNREGKLTPAVFRARRAAGTITETDVISFKRVRTPAPSWQRRIGYDRAWTVQNEDQLIGSPDVSRKIFALNEFRYSAYVDSAIKTEHAGARIVEKDTLLNNSADAITENIRQQAVFSDNPRRFDLIAKRQQFRYSVGETVTINYSRFDIDEDMVILGIRENTNTRRTTFRLFAP